MSILQEIMNSDFVTKRQRLTVYKEAGVVKQRTRTIIHRGPMPERCEVITGDWWMPMDGVYFAFNGETWVSTP